MVRRVVVGFVKSAQVHEIPLEYTWSQASPAFPSSGGDFDSRMTASVPPGADLDFGKREPSS